MLRDSTLSSCFKVNNLTTKLSFQTEDFFFIHIKKREVLGSGLTRTPIRWEWGHLFGSTPVAVLELGTKRIGCVGHTVDSSMSWCLP